jgi:hypothetical protein
LGSEIQSGQFVSVRNRKAVIAYAVIVPRNSNRLECPFGAPEADTPRGPRQWPILADSCSRSRMTECDPRLPFTIDAGNVRNRFANPTQPTKWSLCAAAVGGIVRFSLK